MGGKGGVSRKAAAAARQQEANDAAAAATEDAKWAEGAPQKNSKKEAAAAKEEEARRKKAERDAEIEAEESSAHSAGKKVQKKNKNAAKKSGIDSALSSLEASNIDDAISALELTNGANSDKVDRHPERRFKAALAKYEDGRLPEFKKEHPGLRLNQYKELMYKEFQKHPDNPFNQVTVEFNASQDDVSDRLKNVRKGKEDRLGRK